MGSILYYDWTQFFDAIARSINELSKDIEYRDQKLMEIAKATFQEDHAILRYSTIDPFSYLYALAQRNTKNQRRKTFTNAKAAFSISQEIPTDFIFPTPTPNTLSLFYSNGIYINKNGEVIGNRCIWNLYQQIYNSTDISEDDFQCVLSLKNVGFTKLSQVMFLINPKRYIPFDTQMNSLPVNNLNDLSGIVSRVKIEGIKVYLDVIDELRKTFPGCELYEINLLNVLVNSSESDLLTISSKYCQISSWAYGQNVEDFFNKFVEENGVWTGGPTSQNGAKTYPLTNFKTGDIVLVRRGTKNLGGIGIILDNEYISGGYDEEKVIKIIWLTKENKYVEDDALGQWDGFSQASEKTLGIFKEAYPTTFKIIDEIRKNQRIMVNHSQIKYKNLILQGPPGTGKTRLAKQIAEWLVSEDEKTMSLIEAIDKSIFKKDPDIEHIDQIKLIQFHSSYSYEDFVRGIKAISEEGKIKYVVENRILVRFAEEAAKPENQHKACVLIIDEINRANLTSVLGELIYALEYRGKSVDSMYEYNGNSQISLPHNLYVIGTMNTADRSVSHIDYAIRRRLHLYLFCQQNLLYSITKQSYFLRALR